MPAQEGWLGRPDLQRRFPSCKRSALASRAANKQPVVGAEVFIAPEQNCAFEQTGQRTEVRD